MKQPIPTPPASELGPFAGTGFDPQSFDVGDRFWTLREAPVARMQDDGYYSDVIESEAI